MHCSANIFNETVLQKAQELYKKSSQYQIRQRMHFILLKAKGYTQQLIGDILDVTERTTYYWWQIFQEGGLDALANLHYQGQPSKLKQFSTQLVLDFIAEPVATLKEARHRIIEKTGIERGLTQVREFMLKHKLLRRKVGQIPDKADVTAQLNFIENKLEKLITLAKNSLIQLLFVDASHFVHQPFLGYLYGLTRIFIRSSAGRKRYNVLAAINAMSHQLTTIGNESYINAETVCQLLHKIAKQYVNETIYIILDNARYQRCLLVQQTAEMLGINLVFLPAYSPNLNLIERLWRFVKQEVLYCKFYPTFLEFKSAIDLCLSKIITKYYKNELQSLLTLKFQTFKT